MNITIGNLLVYPFLAINRPEYHTDKIIIHARHVNLKKFTKLLSSLGIKRQFSELKINEYGLIPYNYGDCPQTVGKTLLELDLDSGAEQGMALVVKKPSGKGEKAATLILIEEQVDGRVVGGSGVLIRTGANA